MITGLWKETEIYFLNSKSLESEGQREMKFSSYKNGCI